MEVYNKANRPIHILDYDFNWPLLFEEETKKIRSVLPAEDVLIEHIGSTSIPNMPSKPVIDIALAIGTLKDSPIYIVALEGLGYTYEPEFEKEIPDRRFLWKGKQFHRTHHVSIVEKDSGIWYSNIRFRDYLCTHPDDAKCYAELKRQLASDCVTDIDRYIKGKTEFVESIQQKAHLVQNETD